MKIMLFFLVSFLLVSVALFGTQTNLYKTTRDFPVDSTGGPDDYGYTWIDSEEPGGPTFSWIDITGIGTEVFGLFDDNNVGPFPIGFDFPYYWYTVNQFWVNANGAISFSDPAVYTPQGSSTFFIPNTAAPNDLLIPLGTDLAFEGVDTAKVYYYSNNVDTFIISYINAPAWNIGGLVGAHTFQIILTKQDSCIYFQYGPQDGQFYGGACCTGIENVIGNVGLDVFLNVNPDLLPNYTLKFIPPDTTTYQALDIGIKEAISPESKCVFLFPNEPYTLTATIRNYGNVDAGTFDVSCRLWDTLNVSYFTDTVTVSGLFAGAETTISFIPNWIPPAVNDYYTLIEAILPDDINPSNDSKDVELVVITLPGWMMYDSDPSSASATYWYSAGSGWGQEFTPPQYPITIDSLLVTMSSTNNCNVPILFMDDDGPNGSPGTILYADTIFVPAGTGFVHYTIPIPGGVTINSGKFYAGFIQVGDSFPRMILEQNDPFSRCAWEFTGSWAPYRSKDDADLLIRAYSSSIQGTSEGKVGRKSYALSLLPARPNPVKSRTQIHYALPGNADVSMKVYNLLGQEVRTLVNEHQKAGVHSVTFNAEDSNGNRLPQGVYFYRLTAGGRSLTRKFTILR